MRRRFTRHVLLTAAFVPCFSVVVNGQIFNRGTAAVAETSAACPDGECSANWKSFGYFTEHWRRWPEQYVAPGGPETLGPYAKPSRVTPGPLNTSTAAPAVQVPNVRDEGSAAPRTRPGQAAPAPTAATPAPKVTPQEEHVPSTPPAETMPAPSSRLTPSDRDSSLPFSAPSEEQNLDLPGETPSPTPNSTTPAPNSEEMKLPEDDLPFGDSSEPLPSIGDVDSPEEDGFTLEDLGQVNHQRLRRYQNPVAGQLRRASAAPTTSTARRNAPPRSSSRAAESLAETTPTTTARPAPNRPAKVQRTDATTAVSESTNQVRPASYVGQAGRTNPLRGRASNGRSPIAQPTAHDDANVAPAGYESSDDDNASLNDANLGAAAMVPAHDNPLRRG